MQKLNEILRSLGLNTKYMGYNTILKAVQIVQEDHHKLYNVTKSIYMPIAEERGCTWSAVERSIRTAIQRAWKINPKLIKDMAGYPMAIQPTASEFIEMLAFYTKNNMPLPVNA